MPDDCISIPIMENTSFRRIFGFADLLTMAIMLGTFFSGEGELFRLLNQGLAALLVLIYISCHVRFRLCVPPEFYLAGLFIFWSMLSGMLVAVDRGWVLSYGLMITRFAILSLAISGLTMARRNPARGFMVMTVLMLYLSIWVRTTGKFSELMAGSLNYTQELTINPNLVGLVMLWGFAGILFLWKTTTRIALRAILIVLAIGCIFTLISTGSRGSFIGFLFFVALWIIFCYGKKLLRNMKSLAMIILVIAGIYYIAVKVVPQTYLGVKLMRSAEVGGLDETRTGLYKEAMEMFLSNPVAGVGLGNFTVHSSFQLYSHSDYAEILSTTGFVGFTLYFPIYIILWRRIIRIRKKSNDAKIKYQMGLYKALLLTILAIGIGAPNFLMIHVWFLLALMIGHTYALDRDL